MRRKIFHASRRKHATSTSVLFISSFMIALPLNSGLFAIVTDTPTLIPVDKYRNIIHCFEVTFLRTGVQDVWKKSVEANLNSVNSSTEDLATQLLQIATMQSP